MTTAKSISETLGLRQGPGLSTQEQQALMNRFPYFALLGAMPESQSAQGFQGTTTLPNPVLVARQRQPYIVLPAATNEPDKAVEVAQTQPGPAEDEAGVLTHLPPSEESSKSVEEEPEAPEEAGPESEVPPTEPVAPEAVAESQEQHDAPKPEVEEAADPQSEPAGQAPPEQVATPASGPTGETAQPTVESLAEQSTATPSNESSDMLPSPQFSQDYFRHEGIDVSSELQQKPEKPEEEDEDSQAEQALMVMRSFTEWLVFYRKKSQQEQEEEAAKRSLKAAWQKEKLVAALEEENEEIPQAVFEMAVDSISTKGLVSESLAAIHAKQGKFDKARAMYQNLSEQYPEKSSYFAGLIQKLDEAAAARS